MEGVVALRLDTGQSDWNNTESLPISSFWAFSKVVFSAVPTHCESPNDSSC